MAADVEQMSASEKSSTGRVKKEQAAEDDSTQQFYNMDELLARSKISFKRVQKYYFQWVLLIGGHYLLLFHWPRIGNFKLNATPFCDP